MKKIIKRNKYKFSCVFRCHAYWRKKLLESKERSQFYQLDDDEFVGMVKHINTTPYDSFDLAG